MQIPNKIETLIFDLGGVIIDLAVHRTMEGFASLSGLPVGEVVEIYSSNPGFEAYEKGMIDDMQFRNEARKALHIDAKDEAIDQAWNAMLSAISPKKLELLERLKSDYDVFILSNTNAMHIDHLEKVMLPRVGLEGPLGRFVHKTYYSHHLRMVKPDPQIYVHILTENKIEPDHVLFLDDNSDNVKASRKLGMHSLQITRPDMIFEVFS